MALVVSPLNALTQDQVTSFTKREMAAVHVGSDCSLNVVYTIICGEVQLIYMRHEAVLTDPTYMHRVRDASELQL